MINVILKNKQNTQLYNYISNTFTEKVPEYNNTLLS